MRRNRFTSYVSVLLASLLFSVGIVFADVSLNSSNLSSVSISYRPSPAHIDTLLVNDKNYCLYSYDNHTITNPAGAPAIPAKTVFFAAPEGVLPALELKNISQSQKSGNEISPVPRLVEDEGGFFIEVYKEDPAFYALSGYRPRNFVELGNKIDNNGISIWELILTPVLYDAHASKVAIADSFDVNISFGSGKIADLALSKRIPDYVINRRTFEGPGVRKPAAPISNPFATGNWYRIKITESGMYSISGTELTQTGFPVGTVNSDDIRMYYGGGQLLKVLPHDITTDDFREIAITVRDGGDGVFDKSDAIIFYGESLSRFILQENKSRPEFHNHLFSDENVYWITLSNDGTPERIRATGVIPSHTIPAKTTYRHLKHFEQENHLELVKGGTEWYWDAISTKTKSYSFTAPGCVPGHTTNIRVGILNHHLILSHDLEIFVNEGKPFSFNFPRIIKGYQDITYSGELKQKDNIINILRKGKTTEFVHLDWIDVEYECEMALSDNTLEFFQVGDGKTVKFEISNAKKPTIQVYDTTDPYQVKENSYASYNSKDHTVTFQTTIPNTQTSRFTLWDSDSYLKVSSISKKKHTNLRNPAVTANYFIITHEMFTEEAVKLANWRARDSQIEPLTPMVVDVTDIYDEFNWGVLDYVALRDFLKFQWENGDPNLRYYCCLFGDTSFKYKNLTESQAGKNFVPTYSDCDDYGPLTTDDFFGWFDKHRLPVIAVGRLCAVDKETAGILVDKIIEYERNPVPGLWHNRVLLVADDELRDKGEGQEVVHSNYIESLDSGNYIPRWMERKKIMQIEYPLKNRRKPDVTEALLSAINEGYVAANYIGHGNNDLLAHEHILVGTRDIERFNNGYKQPLFCVFSCTVANFIQPDHISLAEMLHLREGGGCIAVVAATSETYSSGNIDLNKSFYLDLFYREKNPDHRIGYALLLAKHEIHTDNSNRYTLLGDPATRLMMPRYDFSVAPVDTIYRLQKLDLSGTIQDGSESIPYNGTLFIRARGPKVIKKYATRNNLRTIKYTQPGKTFYFGELATTGDSFTAELVIPKDLQQPVLSTGSSSQEEKPIIYFFATGQDVEAAGVLSDLVIGGLDKNAPDDRNGPEIQMAFDGKNFDDGDYISRQPTLRATINDPSGINIYGNRGHNITLLMDKTEIVILTDGFKAVNGFTTGTLEYSLPVLSPGEHVLEMNVYDTYNNVTKKRVTAYVVGSETGDISILNLLNYPNPMDSQETSFTFNLTDDARHADIKIYSQSGRLVDTIKFPAGYGFNQIQWKPPFTLANGVYFYKLTVTSVNGRKSSKIEKLVVMK